MKIIAKTNDSFICEVTSTEIANVFNCFLADNLYNEKKMPVYLDVGVEVPLNHGYKFTNDIKHACDSMQRSMEAFEMAKTSLEGFTKMVTDFQDINKKPAIQKVSEIKIKKAK